MRARPPRYGPNQPASRPTLLPPDGYAFRHATTFTRLFQKCPDPHRQSTLVNSLTDRPDSTRHTHAQAAQGGARRGRRQGYAVPRLRVPRPGPQGVHGPHGPRPRESHQEGDCPGLYVPAVPRLRAHPPPRRHAPRPQAPEPPRRQSQERHQGCRPRPRTRLLRAC